MTRSPSCRHDYWPLTDCPWCENTGNCTVTLILHTDTLTCQLRPHHPGLHYSTGVGGGFHWIEQVTQ
jgi:hypothetical protein